MKHHLIPKEGHFYKANLHTHTTVSDGKHTPEEIKAIYKARGYSVVAFTDHNRMVSHEDLCDEGFLALTSFEIDTNGAPLIPTGLAIPTYHLNLFAKSSVALDDDMVLQPRQYSVEGQNALIAEAGRRGYLVSYNHPDWSVQHYPDYAGLEGLCAVEVYNTGCVVEGWNLDEGDHVLDDLLFLGKRVYPVATDDCHADHDLCGGWVRFKAPALTYDDIMNAYENGDFYASWGPDIETLTIEHGILRVTCTEAVKISVHTGLRFARQVESTEGMTEAAFDLNGYIDEVRRAGCADRAYFRVVVTDAKGHKALTRGYFIDELGDMAGEV